MIKAAVIGVGAMGKHHARIYSSLKDIQLVGVSDLDNKVGKEIAGMYNTKFYSNYTKLISDEKPDIISVAVPTSVHKEVALNIINKGISLLIEKPLAPNVSDAKKIVNAAKKKKVILAIGHIERFNPAIIQLNKLIHKGVFGNILSIVVRRVGVYPPRIKDVNVVTDIAVHDLDIVCKLTSKRPTSVFAKGGKSLTKDREDHAEILLDFGNFGCFIQVNWVTPVKIRTLSITGDKAHAELNYLTQEIEIYKSFYKVKKNEDYKGFIAQFAEPKHKQVKVKHDEPLLLEIIDFIDCVKNHKKPEVSGNDAILAIELSEAVNKSIKTNEKVFLHPSHR